MKTLLLFVFLIALPAVSLGSAQIKQGTAQRPILLYASRTDCRFCYNFEKEILNPLIQSGEYTDSIVIRNLVLDSTELVENFEGKLVSPNEFAQIYDIKLSPSLLFLDTKGRELIPRIVGYQRSEFYFYYFEEAIHKAIAALSAPSRSLKD